MMSFVQREKREHERHEIVHKAVQAADRIILDGSVGSVEETNFLTAEVASIMVTKALHPYYSVLLQKDLNEDVGEQRTTKDELAEKLGEKLTPYLSSSYPEYNERGIGKRALKLANELIDGLHLVENPSLR